MTTRPIFASPIARIAQRMAAGNRATQLRASRPRRYASSSEGPKPGKPSSTHSTSSQQASASQQQQRAHKILDRMPRFLRKYTDGLRSAPISHVASFLILHEITAVVPLVSLATFFHYTGWLPTWLAEGKYISDGISKFGSYFRRKGWFGFDREESKRVTIFNYSEKGSRIVVEVATAYAVTKLLLPARIVFSVALTPWFARVAVRRAGGMVKRMFGRGRKAKTSTDLKPTTTTPLKPDENKAVIAAKEAEKAQRP